MISRPIRDLGICITYRWNGRCKWVSDGRPRLLHRRHRPRIARWSTAPIGLKREINDLELNDLFIIFSFCNKSLFSFIYFLNWLVVCLFEMLDLMPVILSLSVNDKLVLSNICVVKFSLVYGPSVICYLLFALTIIDC